MRVHELAVQNWLNSHFHVRAGYPVPVVFGTPMAAFAEFRRLWSSTDNPFAYLLECRDAHGRSLYEPYPANIRYPIISVGRNGWQPRPGDNYSIHRERRSRWYTDAQNPIKADLISVGQHNMPMAWNFNYRVEFYCNRPDTEAVFVNNLMLQFWRTGGTELQTWIKAIYPPFWQWLPVRTVMDANIEHIQGDPADEERADEIRVGFNLRVEGWVPDMRIDIKPTFWLMKFASSSPLSPTDLDNIFGGTTVDQRVNGVNPVLESRGDSPPVDLGIVPDNDLRIGTLIKPLNSSTVSAIGHIDIGLD